MWKSECAFVGCIPFVGVVTCATRACGLGGVGAFAGSTSESPYARVEWLFSRGITESVARLLFLRGLSLRKLPWFGQTVI
jgi:hypothetical protein